MAKYMLPCHTPGNVDSQSRTLRCYLSSSKSSCLLRSHTFVDGKYMPACHTLDPASFCLFHVTFKFSPFNLTPLLKAILFPYPLLWGDKRMLGDSKDRGRRLGGMEAQTLVNREIVLERYADEGPVTNEHIKIREDKLEVPKDDGSSTGNVLVQNLWISVDPYLRQLMKQSNDGLYLANYKLHEPIKSLAVSKVIASAHPGFKAGDIGVGFHDVSEYCLVPAVTLRKIEQNALPLHSYLSVFGIPGLAAWIGFVLIGKPKPGEQVFVSAAAGAVGLVVGQLAKIKGCRVVGSVGSDEKVRLLKEEFGFDDAFNYKTETDYDAALRKYFPQGIDIYFENVGGRMLEAVLNHINKNGRIPVCGMISHYNQDWGNREGVKNLLNLVGKCVKMEGFLIGEYLHHFPAIIEEMTGYIKDGKIKCKDHITEGLDSFFETFSSIFNGQISGKALVHLADP